MMTMKDFEPNLMSDADLDRLLAAASRPQVPMGAQSRLLQRVAAERQPQASTTASRPWIFALPLAASLVLGVYMGVSGFGAGLITGTDDTYASAADFETGLEEAELAAEEDQS
jgi:hypothetical protein